ncbi:unnamed protein product [Sphagnum compactum]
MKDRDMKILNPTPLTIESFCKELSFSMNILVCHLPITYLEDILGMSNNYGLGGAIDSLTVAAGGGGAGHSSRSRWSEQLEQQPCGGISVEPETKGGLTREPPCTTSSAAAAAAAAASNKQVDYVHVRARRGQATDSHSLAERVRREKISERMKYLQELVPGCSKVTGKAVMLDEIINYVESLRRQVEFLSMKLASVNSQLDFNLDSILNKEMLWSQDSAVLLPEPSLSYGLHLPPLIQQHLATDGPDFQSLATIDTLLCRRAMSAPISVPCTPNADAFGDDLSTQMSIEWDGELQTMFQMGFGQVSRATPLMEGSFNTCHMKVEL